MKKINGFTLIEMLVILTAISMLSILIVPSLFSLVKKQELENFFNVLDADVLFIQNEALVNRNVRITFEADRYIVRVRSKGDEFVRNYPDNLTYRLGNNRIRFQNDGTLLTPTTHRFEDEHNIYALVFPLGKGRHYIEKQ